MHFLCYLYIFKALKNGFVIIFVSCLSLKFDKCLIPGILIPRPYL